MNSSSSKNERPIHVLMIGIGDDVLDHELSDTLDRHLHYARSAGRLSMIVYAPRFFKSPLRRVGPHLRIIPARARSRIGFLFSAYKTGLELSRGAMPDLITVQDPFGAGLVGYFLKRRLKIPLEVQNHSDFFDNPHWISQRPLIFPLFNILGKFIIRQADSLRVVNRAEGKKYRRYGIAPHRIKVLPVPANLERFNVKVSQGALGELDRRWNLKKGEKVLLWVGRAVWLKRVPILLQAVKILSRERSDFRMLVVGDGPKLPSWKILTERLGIHHLVIFTGRIPHPDLPLYISRCFLLILSSIIEGLPRIPIEAGISAKPVVATRISGVEEIISDEVTGLLVEPENPRDMADKIATLLDNPELAARMGLAAREKILKEFDRTEKMESISSNWQEIVAGIGEATIEPNWSSG